jgi:hypothetical protein
VGDENPASDQPGKPLDSSPEVQIAEPTDSPDTTTKPATELQDVKKELGSYERATLKWTIVIVCVNALTCLFIGLQWLEMKSGSADTHALAEAAKKQSEKMANVSDAADRIRGAAQDMVVQDQRIADNSQKAIESSAKQSRTTLNATIEEFRLEHRAWLSLGEIDFVRAGPSGNQQVQISQLHSGEKIWVNVTYKNTGGSPAFNVRTAARADIFIQAPTFNPLPHPSPYGILQPGEQIFQTIEWQSLTAVDIVALNSSYVYIYGRIDYRDAFNIPHWTTFCRRMLSGGGQSQCIEQSDTTDTNTEKNPN